MMESISDCAQSPPGRGGCSAGRRLGAAAAKPGPSILHGSGLGCTSEQAALPLARQPWGPGPFVHKLFRGLTTPGCCGAAMHAVLPFSPGVLSIGWEKASRLGHTKEGEKVNQRHDLLGNSQP